MDNKELYGDFRLIWRPYFEYSLVVFFLTPQSTFSDDNPPVVDLVVDA